MKLYAMSEAGSLIAEFLIEEFHLDCVCLYPDEAERQTEAFRSLSPYGRIPVLVMDDGEAVFESLAIVLVLIHKSGGTPLAPKPDEPGYGRFLSWLSYLATTLYDVQLRYFHCERYGETESVKKAALAEMVTIYDHIEKQPYRFVAGDEIGVADLYLFMLLFWDEALDEHLATRPKLRAIHDAVAGRETVKRVLARQPAP